MIPSKKYCASAAADLTDDLIVEILSRLPAKSICRFKCVSCHWYNLITRPEHRKKIPQTLSGFFYHTGTSPDFVDIMGREKLPFSDPSLSFLTGYRLIDPKSCCNGLLLCLCWKVSPSDEEADYVVCNPATEKWVVVPESNPDHDACAHYYLGFDPDVSSHFHVFQLLEKGNDYEYTLGVSIYSSETGAWSHKENGWSSELEVNHSQGVFLNGMLHLMAYGSKILAVDTEGKTWRTIPLLETMRVVNPFEAPHSFIGQSQGRLYYINTRVVSIRTSVTSVWILEDYDSGEWVLKYSISSSQLSGERNLRYRRDYFFMGIHPQCNLIYFVRRCEDNMLMSYEMDRGKGSAICSLKEHLCGPFIPYLPYVPFILDSLADQD